MRVGASKRASAVEVAAAARRLSVVMKTVHNVWRLKYRTPIDACEIRADSCLFKVANVKKATKTPAAAFWPIVMRTRGLSNLDYGNVQNSTVKFDEADYLSMLML
jgi:hypothetical protein